LKARELARLIARAAAEKKAEDIMVLDIGKLLIITDYFVICSGKTARHVKTIFENIQRKLGEKAVRPLGVEGQSEAYWILLDCGDVIAHIFTERERDYYQLERLWKDASQLNWDESLKKKCPKSST